MPPSVNVVSTGDREIDYGKLRKDLERVVARLCPSWLSSQRDDLVQTAVMRVMQIVEADPPRPEGSRALASFYLYKVAHSALVDEIRRVRRRREAPLEPTEDVAAHTGTHLDPERMAASKQIGRGIQDCLTRMNRDRRLAVTLYLQGHTVPEASRILDWSAKRTENLVYRGLADLRACLQVKGMRP
jgi:RNA polymerase sigma-70 factor (ECF subfamily)